METNLKNALVDVRKAYRQLFMYQKRILDMMSFLDHHTELEYEGGYPHWSACTKEGKRAKLDDWSWDWLNMYLYEFRFILKKHGQQFYFSAVLLSDDGFYSKPDTDPLDPFSFENPEDSNSYLIFLLRNDYQINKGKSIDDESFWEKIILKQNTLSKNGDLVIKKYLLEDLPDSKALIAGVEVFNKFCKKSGLPQIQIIEKV